MTTKIQFNPHWLDLKGHPFRGFDVCCDRASLFRYAAFVGGSETASGIEVLSGDMAKAFPTYAFSFEMKAGVVSEVVRLLGIPGSALLHAGQNFIYFQPVTEGQHLNVSSRVSDTFWNSATGVFFLTKETLFSDGERVVLKSESVYAVRAEV